MELFFNSLQKALGSDVDITEGIVWGGEVSLLQQPAPFIPSIVASESPPSIPDELPPPPLEALIPPVSLPENVTINKA